MRSRSGESSYRPTAKPGSTGFVVAAEDLEQRLTGCACASISQKAVSMPALAKLLPGSAADELGCRQRRVKFFPINAGTQVTRCSSRQQLSGVSDE